MIDFLKKAKWLYLAVTFVYIVIGLCLILWPLSSAAILCRIIGVVTVVYGLAKILTYLRPSLFGASLPFDFAAGALAVIAGLALLFCADDVVKALPIIVGFLVAADGVFKLQGAIDLILARAGGGFVMLLISVLCCLSGVLLVLNPVIGVFAATMLMGVALTLDGVCNLWNLLYVRKAFKG